MATGRDGRRSERARSPLAILAGTAVTRSRTAVPLSIQYLNEFIEAGYFTGDCEGASGPVYEKRPMLPVNTPARQETPP
jgi:hypothetical protein